MEAFGEILANFWWLSFIVALFAIFALIGYISENKNGARKKIDVKTLKPESNIEENLEKIKSNLANSNKSLNSMVTNQGGAANNSATNSNGVNQPIDKL